MTIPPYFEQHLDNNVPTTLTAKVRAARRKPVASPSSYIVMLRALEYDLENLSGSLPLASLANLSSSFSLSISFKPFISLFSINQTTHYPLPCSCRTNSPSSRSQRLKQHNTNNNTKNHNQPNTSTLKDYNPTTTKDNNSTTTPKNTTTKQRQHNNNTTTKEHNHKTTQQTTKKHNHDLTPNKNSTKDHCTNNTKKATYTPRTKENSTCWRGSLDRTREPATSRYKKKDSPLEL
ncbi:probable serine/threonine-protein kinase fhkB [Macrobrachium nipponense]|uniref:probable serine/threonine-protein kinase fhkB n=1 Tax=Macrobrachium nipponense TaxID=159736 RepID=UPI0030C88E3F